MRNCLRHILASVVILLISIFQSTSIQAQTDPSCDQIVTFSIGDLVGEVGDEVCIPFTVSNFQRIVSFQFSMSFDPTVLEFVQALDPNNLNTFDITNIISLNAAQGYLRVLWFQANVQPETLPDGTEIFSLCFRIIGNPSQNSVVVINEIPVSVELVLEDENGNSCPPINTINQDTSRVIVNCSTFDAITGFCTTETGTSNGSISFFGCGGVAPYSYDLNGTMGSGIADRQEVIIPNLTPGDYTLILTDSNGAMVQKTITLTAGPELALSVLATPPTCATARFPNGRMSASAMGGLGPYTFRWSTTPANITAIDELTNGTYTVTLTDSNGCRKSQQRIFDTEVLSLDINILDSAYCDIGLPGSRGGRFNLVAGGGMPQNGSDYIYRVNTPSGPLTSTGSEFFAINVQTGLVSIQVEDFSVPRGQCRLDTSFIMPFRKSLDINATVENISCFGANDGSIIPNIVSTTNRPPTSNYTYTLRDVDDMVLDNAVVNSPNYPFINLLAGEYRLQVSDGDGCLSYDTLIISEPTEVQLSLISQIDPGCTGGGMNGEITVSGTGGTGQLDYLWNDGNTSPQRTGLSDGQYSVTVTDQNMCSTSDSYTLNPGGALTVQDILITNISCPGDNNGSITIIMAGNSSNLTYEWAERPTETSNTINNLSGGTYTVSVSDNGACEVVLVLDVSEPAALQYTINPDIPVCPGQLGNLSVEVTGGVQPISYQWLHANNNGGPTLPAIPAGDYGLIITDGNGCSLNPTITLDDPSSISVDVSNIVAVRCFGDNNGQAMATASGGTVNPAAYLYTWSSGEATTAPTGQATTLDSGQQYVIVSDGECATDSIFFEVPTPQILSLNLDNTVITPPTCNGLSNGSIQAQGQGGTGLITYTWPQSGLTGSLLQNVASGNVQLLLTDNNNCMVSDSVFVSEPPLLEASIDSFATVNLSCAGNNTGIITVKYTGGNDGQVGYQWTNNVSTGPSASSLSQGIYQITVSDVMGCTSVATYELTAPQDLVAVFDPVEEPLCFGGRTCISVGQVTGGTGTGYRFSINNGPLYAIDTCINVFAGTYDLAVFDSDGCSTATSMTINQPPQLTIKLSATDSLPIDLGFSTLIKTNINTIVEIESITWDPLDNLMCEDDNCLTVSVIPSENTIYTAMIRDINGCTAEDQIEITVSEKRNVYIPNIFQPSSTGENSTFKIYTGNGVASLENFQIFDRWGNQIHDEDLRATPPSSSGVGSWDGKFNNQSLDSGVYVYVVKVNFIDNFSIIYKGTVTLIK